MYPSKSTVCCIVLTVLVTFHSPSITFATISCVFNMSPKTSNNNWYNFHHKIIVIFCSVLASFAVLFLLPPLYSFPVSTKCPPTIIFFCLSLSRVMSGLHTVLVFLILCYCCYYYYYLYYYYYYYYHYYYYWNDAFFMTMTCNWVPYTRKIPNAQNRSWTPELDLWPSEYLVQMLYRCAKGKS